MFEYGLTSIASLLTHVPQKNKKFEWQEACEKSFQLFNDRLTSTQVLTLPDGTNCFVVYCDASRVGFGVCLCNMGK